MEKTRVPIGEKYWYIGVYNGIISVFMATDYHSLYIRDKDVQTDLNFKYGNYFRTQEEAESMARKLRAVLNGADVIKMPSESDIVTERDLRMTDCDVYGEFELAFQDGFYECYEYLKSKIVK